MFRKKTDLKGTVDFNVSGIQSGSQKSFSQGVKRSFHVTSNEEVLSTFATIVTCCGDDIDKQFNEIHSRTVEFSLSGQINGANISYKCYSEIDLARFLKEHGVDVGYDRELLKAKAEQGEGSVKFTDVQMDGLIDGQVVDHQDFRSTSEILNFLNHTCEGKGYHYQKVSDDEVVMTKDKLAAMAKRSQSVTIDNATTFFGLNLSRLPVIFSIRSFAETLFSRYAPRIEDVIENDEHEVPRISQ